MVRTIVSREALGVGEELSELGATLSAGDADSRPTFGHLTPEPTKRAQVPFDGLFAEEDDFLPAPEIDAIGTALIAAYPELSFLAEAEIAYVWKRKGGRSQANDVYGKCTPTSGLLRHFAGCDFVVWIGADHVREAGFTNLQLEALVYHELRHIGYELDEKTGEMKLIGRGHDDEIFVEEVLRYGCWNHNRRKAGEAYQQVPLGGGA